ncbi:MAG: hypothetical protein ACI8TP_003861 [Acidimicrobiales bacterium]|jgi:hypothetical protein
MTEGRQPRRRRIHDALIATAFGALVLSAGALAVSSLFTSRSNDQDQVRGELAYDAPRVSFTGARSSALGAAALDQLDYPWQTQLEGWTIEFVDAEGDVAGYAWSQERRIEVFVRPGDDASVVARVLAHELGHAVDVSLFDGDNRRAWLEQRQAEDVDWWPTSGAADFETGAGDFAECFAAWFVGTRDFRSRVAGKPTPEDFAFIERISLD